MSCPPSSEATEIAEVARVLALLGGLEDTPVAAHVEVFDGVHRLLQDALATVDGA